MKISNSPALMEELFSLKRQEKPPVNFFSDFIQEFHRLIEPSADKPRPFAAKLRSPAFKWNVTQSS